MRLVGRERNTSQIFPLTSDMIGIVLCDLYFPLIIAHIVNHNITKMNGLDIYHKSHKFKKKPWI